MVVLVLFMFLGNSDKSYSNLEICKRMDVIRTFIMIVILLVTLQNKKQNGSMRHGDILHSHKVFTIHLHTMVVTGQAAQAPI